MNRVVFVFEGGGMRNAFVSGVLATLQESGIDPSVASAVYACSSAAPTAAFYMAGQAELALIVWLERLTAPEIFDLARARRREPVGDIDLVVDHACADLDLDAVLRGPQLTVNVVRERDGETLYLPVTRPEARQLLKATCALPGIARPILLDDERVYDGGISDPLPVRRALMDGHRRLVVFSNRPRGFRIPMWERTIPAVAFHDRPHMLKSFLLRASAYHSVRDLIENPPSNIEILLMAPDHDLSCSMFSRDKTAIAATIAKGRAYAEKRIDALTHFLGQ